MKMLLSGQQKSPHTFDKILHYKKTIDALVIMSQILLRYVNQSEVRGVNSEHDPPYQTPSITRLW